MAQSEMPDENIQAPPKEGDTPVEPSITTPPTSKDTVESKRASESTPEPKGHVDEKTEEAKRREEGKLKQTQEELERIRQYSQTLENSITRNPDRHYKVLVEGGVSAQEASKIVTSANPTWQAPEADKDKAQPGEAPAQPAQPYLTPSQQAALSKIEIEEEATQERRLMAANKFMDKHPELDKLTRQSIAYEAFRLETTQGMTPEDAVETAGRKIISPDEIRREGEIEGMSKALSGVSPSAGGAAGTVAPGDSGKTITAQDEEVMRKLGLKSKKAKAAFMEHKQES